MRWLGFGQILGNICLRIVTKIFCQDLSFFTKKHHFHDFLAFFSHFFMFFEREFHVVGGTLGHEFGGNIWSRGGK